MFKRTLTAVVALTLTGVGLVAVRAAEAVPPPLTTGCPTLVSHKTADGVNPANTEVGIRNARDVHNVDTVEVDIRFNKSHFAFAMHDDNIANTTNGTGSIRDKWFPDLRALTAADYAPWNTDSRYKGFKADGTPVTPVPYTWTILNNAKQKNLDLVLDVKVAPDADDAASFKNYLTYPEFAGMADRLVWMAGTPAALTTMRGYAPELHYWLINQPATGTMWTGEYLKTLGAEVVSYHISMITPQMVDYYHAFGIGVNTWTSNNATEDVAANWQKAINADVDYLTTNKPNDARALCAVPTTPPTTVVPTMTTNPPTPSTEPSTPSASTPPVIG